MIEVVLRSPAETARRALAGESLRPLVATSIASIAAGGAAFGAVVGSFRGGPQIAYAALKLPLALLAALVVCVPAFHALFAALGRRWSYRAVIALSLAAAARGALVLFALAPLLWLAIDRGLDYHATALAATLCFALGGAAALGVLLRGVGDGRGRLASALAITLVFLAVSGQTSWILRPWLVRPRTDEAPFLRAREGSVVDALVRSTRSAAGVYEGARTRERWESPPSERAEEAY